MKKRYDELMDRIEVTDKMRERILDRIQGMDIATPPERKVIPFPKIKKYMSIAACFVVLAVGTFAICHTTGVLQPNDPPVQVANEMVQVDTREQLAAAVGFEIEELDVLPFEVETTAYVSYWNELAEITYTGEGQTATFRKSIGTEDNSGDYSAYSDVRELNIGALPVTLKGSGEVYTLAVWSANGYSYSINLSDGITESEWYDFISEVLAQ